MFLTLRMRKYWLLARNKKKEHYVQTFLSESPGGGDQDSKSQVKVGGYNRIRYKDVNWIRLRTVQWQALMNALMNR